MQDLKGSNAIGRDSAQGRRPTRRMSAAAAPTRSCVDGATRTSEGSALSAIPPTSVSVAPGPLENPSYGCVAAAWASSDQEKIIPRIFMLRSLRLMVVQAGSEIPESLAGREGALAHQEAMRDLAAGERMRTVMEPPRGSGIARTASLPPRCPTRRGARRRAPSAAGGSVI